MELSRTKAINIINSLKNGIITNNSVEHMLVGRKNVINEFDEILSNTIKGIGNIKFITGEFGSGKTFMLNLTKEMALNKGFVVSKIQLDRSFRFNKLEDLYYNIMHNLYIDIKNSNSKTSFEDIFEKWIDNLQKLPSNEAQNKINYVIESISKYNISFGRAFLSFVKAQIHKEYKMKNAIVSWMTGEKNIPYILKQKFEIIGDITKVNMLDFLKAFIILIQLIGYNGLIILVDEMDTLLNERKDIRYNAFTNIKYLIDTTVSGEFNNTSYFFFGSDILFNDEDRGIKNHEALFHRIGNKNNSKNNFHNFRKTVISLEKFDLSEYQMLTDKIVNIYTIVYDINLKISTESLKNWVFLILKQEKIPYKNITIRDFIRKLIETLDIIQQNPDNNVFKSELYMQLINNQLFFKSNIIKK